MTAVNLIVLIRMAYITERLVKLCKIYCDNLTVAYMKFMYAWAGGRTLRHDQIFSDG